MTRDKFIEQLKNNFGEAMELVREKNQDYAGETDPFKNFRYSEMLGVPVDLGILVRMTDKLARVANLRNREGKVKDESVEDTLLDIINYANILLTYYQNES